MNIDAYTFVLELFMFIIVFAQFVGSVIHDIHTYIRRCDQLEQLNRAAG